MQPLWIGVALFVVVDAVVIYFVMKKVMTQRAGLGNGGFANIARFARPAAEETKAYLAANYGGDPATLPSVLQGLVERLSQRAREQGLTLDRETLKQFAATAVVSLKAAKSSDVREALQSVS